VTATHNDFAKANIINLNGKQVTYDPRTSRHVVFSENGKLVARPVLQLRQGKYAAFVAEQLRDAARIEKPEDTTFAKLDIDPSYSWKQEPGDLLEDIREGMRIAREQAQL
jgi:topoisomerase IA-like protein